MSRHLLMLITLMATYSICVLFQRNYTAWNWHLFKFLSFRLYMFLFSFLLLTCDHLKFKRSVVHKSAHSNALIPFSPAPLSHLVQLEIILWETFSSVYMVFLYSLPTFLPPSLLSCLFFPLFMISIFPHHFCFNPSSEMVGDISEVDDLE